MCLDNNAKDLGKVPEGESEKERIMPPEAATGSFWNELDKLDDENEDCAREGRK